MYNYEPVSGDARFCGTTASMCGIEKAVYENDAKALKRAIRLDIMQIHGQLIHGIRASFA